MQRSGKHALVLTGAKGVAGIKLKMNFLLLLFSFYAEVQVSKRTLMQYFGECISISI